MLSFPVLQVALFAAVATAALPYLGRGLQRIIEIFIALVALACAVGGTDCRSMSRQPGHRLGRGAVIRLVFGSPLGLPSDADVRGCWPDLGIGRRHPAGGPAGLGGGEIPGHRDRRAIATAPDQLPLDISVYGRDAADARLLTKAGRFVLYRDSGPSLAVTRLQQVEHEAFLTLPGGPGRCGRARHGRGGDGRARPATRCWSAGLPPGTALADADAADVSDAALDDLYRQLLSLRRARIAHGAISGDDPARRPGGAGRSC